MTPEVKKFVKSHDLLKAVGRLCDFIGETFGSVPIRLDVDTDWETGKKTLMIEIHSGDSFDAFLEKERALFQLIESCEKDCRLDRILISHEQGQNQ